MKKILFVANVTKEHILKFHIPTIKKFKDEGWEVDVASHGEDEIPLCDNQFNAPWRRNPFTVNTLKGIRWLKKIINQNDYDVIYCHTPVGGLVGRLASITARKNGAKVVYCAHGLHFYKGAPLINWLIYYPIEKFLAKFTDLLITINTEDYNTVKDKFSSNITPVLIDGIGVNFERLKIDNALKWRDLYRKELKIPQDATVLIYIAELIKNKNQRLLIHALKLLLENDKNIFLLLVGPDHINGEYEKLAANLNISDNIRFLGWRNDISQLLISSDICTSSSLREGFGINLVEAMYHNLPVVATNNRGHNTIIKNGDNGFIIKNNTAKEMAEAVSYLVKNPQIKKSFSNFDVSKYDCNIIANELYGIITDNKHNF